MEEQKLPEEWENSMFYMKSVRKVILRKALIVFLQKGITNPKFSFPFTPFFFRSLLSSSYKIKLWKNISALQFFCSLLSIIYLNENKYYENVRTCLYFVAIKRFSCLTGYIYAIKRLYSPSEDHALTLEICLISALYFLFVMLIIETKSYVLTKKLVCETFFVNI